MLVYRQKRALVCAIIALHATLSPKHLFSFFKLQIENFPLSMAAPGGFPVIIARGGFAGLTLANALENAGIDYVLLEARHTVAPLAGALVGFFHDGTRLLDQLECLEPIFSNTCALLKKP